MCVKAFSRVFYIRNKHLKTRPKHQHQQILYISSNSFIRIKLKS